MDEEIMPEILDGELLDATDPDEVAITTLQALADRVDQLAIANGRAPLMQGSFAIYLGPKGELILVTETPDRGVERKIFPKRLVKLMMMTFGKALGKANPGEERPANGLRRLDE